MTSTASEATSTDTSSSTPTPEATSTDTSSSTPTSETASTSLSTSTSGTSTPYTSTPITSTGTITPSPTTSPPTPTLSGTTTTHSTSSDGETSSPITSMTTTTEPTSTDASSPTPTSEETSTFHSTSTTVTSASDTIASTTSTGISTLISTVIGTTTAQSSSTDGGLSSTISSITATATEGTNSETSSTTETSEETSTYPLTSTTVTSASYTTASTSLTGTSTLTSANGGSWDGIKCICTLPYYGPRCEMMLESLQIEPPPEIVTAQVELSVTVTNKNYTEHESDQFLNFKKLFTEQMNRFYSGIPEYYGINITKILSGSVVVVHNVLLRTSFTPEYKKVLDSAAQKVVKEIMNTTKWLVMTDNKNCSDTLCYRANATKLEEIRIQYDPEAECREKAGKDFAQYFVVEYKNDLPHCITACMPGFKISMDCHFGRCLVQRDGPQCFCPNTDTHWYSGEYCEMRVQRNLVYGLVGTAIAVVLVVLFAILVIMLRSKKEVKRQKHKVSQLYRWHEEHGGPEPGTFQNTNFDISGEPENSVSLSSISSRLQPSLRHIDHEAKLSNSSVRARVPGPHSQSALPRPAGASWDHYALKSCNCGQ
ncbi:PREDICTED: mucin-17 [Elephantulus edwardii]|uniref:mucin-17 n=1 Tax=Elephantulus edwardii TaxID=28737 RepID=UPI0003F0E97C|nr:PREDICTED: mucin-17 [Elephantulus edwardii]